MKLSELTPENNWELLKRDKNGNTCHTYPNDGFLNSRFEGTIDCPFRDAKDLIIDFEKTNSWKKLDEDKMMEAKTTLH